MAKTEYWDAVFDDTLLLLGRLPVLAAYVYRRNYKNGEHIPAAGPDVDWGANLAHMLGVE